MKPLDAPNLGLTDADAEVRFEQLQAKLIPFWRSIKGLNPSDQQEQTVVVVPSQTVEDAKKVSGQGADTQAYEERFLFLLLLLRQPRTRLVYATSQTILPATLDYYLSLLPGVIPSHARARFFNVSPEDRSARPLTTKILERPNLCARIRSLIPDRDRSHLITYNVTIQERDLALRLGIPLYGPDPSLFYVESKAGSRKVFAKAGVALPWGREDLYSVDDLKEALLALRREKPQIGGASITLGRATSGDVTAFIDLSGLPDSSDPAATSEIDQRLNAMHIDADSSKCFGPDGFFASMSKVGAAVEERIQGPGFHIPSVQMRISPLGDVEVLSTHDQILGKPTEKQFLGSRFPAQNGYAGLIGREARKVGERLADMGALGHITVEFVVVQNDDGQWSAYGVGINLRRTGASHPFMILQFLTDGAYHEQEGLFRAPSGQEKHYLASDRLQSRLYRTFTPTDLFDIVIRHGLHFDQSRQTGVLLHMLATVGETGRFGVVAVGNTFEQAQQLHDQVQTVVKNEAKLAIKESRLPEP